MPIAPGPRRDSESELSRLESDLKAAMQMLIAHKEAVGGAISRAAGAVRQVKAELAAGGAPRPVAVAVA